MRHFRAISFICISNALKDSYGRTEYHFSDRVLAIVPLVSILVFGTVNITIYPQRQIKSNQYITECLLSICSWYYLDINYYRVQGSFNSAPDRMICMVITRSLLLVPQSGHIILIIFGCFRILSLLQKNQKGLWRHHKPKYIRS